MIRRGRRGGEEEERRRQRRRRRRGKKEQEENEGKEDFTGDDIAQAAQAFVDRLCLSQPLSLVITSLSCCVSRATRS
eukprot:574216-Hanusia_phi.AAC.1